jgi:hypothetical protein
VKHRPSGWSVAWLGWLLAFLFVELPGAILPGKGETLSEHVWRWFPTWPRRVIFAAFWLALGAHFVFGASAWWLLTAAPLVACIVWAEFVEGGD